MKRKSHSSRNIKPAKRIIPSIAVLCSGQGTNLQAILDAIRSGKLRARVAIVVSDRNDAPAIKRASKAGVEAHFLDPKSHADRADYEGVLIRLLEEHQVELICLAGFMRLLSRMFVQRYPNRILNVHPALLPAFPGAHAVRDALLWGVKVTGVSVHFVDEEMDHGPIILQETIAIDPRDNEETLLQKLHRVEHRLYPQAIQGVLEGNFRVVGRKVEYIFGRNV